MGFSKGGRNELKCNTKELIRINFEFCAMHKKKFRKNEDFQYQKLLKFIILLKTIKLNE